MYKGMGIYRPTFMYMLGFSTAQISLVLAVEQLTSFISMDLLDPFQRLLFLQYLVDLQQKIVAQDAAIFQLIQIRQNRRGGKRRRVWVRPWLMRRPLLGHYERLMEELMREDVPAYKNFVRMEPPLFREMLDRLTHKIAKKDTWYRKAIKPGVKLAITLRHLATGDSYPSLMYAFRVAANTISGIVNDVCKAILDEYAEEVIAVPTTPQEWLAIAEQFSTRWNFHHCLGAMDEKHFAIKCPMGAGSLYFNYKKFHSIVLLAVVDADYKFIWVDVGANGGASDSQIFNSSELRECIEDGSINFPPPDTLPNDDEPIEYFIIGDDAFPLRVWMMKPFGRRNCTIEERIFKYRLSRARRVSENAFGIIANRLRVLLTTMQQDPKTVGTIVSACCCLHNLMRIRYPVNQNLVMDREDDNHQLAPGSWRNDADLTDLEPLGRGNRATAAAKRQRGYLKHYYASPAGEVPWQMNMI
ncbi:Protein ANTAGONIST OF LIKE HETEROCHROMATIN PROTEIN 1 [Holothuria leucospilota]|uniref:Protein ANTAGONIST OF LIKE HETEROCHROMATIN PROTEIN 1 n=1 Tax=Holothuria leucospilota TaxID=206669 RepID=A0A9Q1BH47_HOLLE|nr:Protein ANTAGONIST OF LIKE HETEROCHROMATIN PROTEIN 1 [Holothuria leucospilota]